jgi:hypothetical protein
VTSSSALEAVAAALSPHVASVRGLADLPAAVQLLPLVPLFYALGRGAGDIVDFVLGPPPYGERAKVWGAMGFVVGVTFWGCLVIFDLLA